MVAITRVVDSDEDKVEYIADAKSLSDAQFVIVTTPTGYYAIEARSPNGGQLPLICSDRFTSLSQARKGLQAYLIEIGPQLRKKEIMRQGIERRQAKANGEG